MVVLANLSHKFFLSDVVNLHSPVFQPNTQRRRVMIQFDTGDKLVVQTFKFKLGEVVFGRQVCEIDLVFADDGCQFILPVQVLRELLHFR